ncbi:hypothetical protein PMAYCL1PPCAC_18099, partial [Pristionchus mayeri]
ILYLQMALTLYTVIGCARCSKARRWLTKLEVPFMERCLDRDALVSALLPLSPFHSIQASVDIRNLLHGLQPDPPLLVSPYGLVANYESLARAVEHDTLLDLIMAESILGRPDGHFGLPSDLLHFAARESNWNESRDELTKNASIDSCDSSSLSSIPDDLLRLLHEIKSSSLIRDNRVGLVRLYRNSFKGDHFVDWCIGEKEMTRKEAGEMGQDLLDRNIIQQSSREHGETFSPDRYYQLVEDDENKPLNSGEPPLSQPVTVAELNEQFVRLIQPIYENICVGRGNVAYYRLTENDDLLRYLMASKQLQTVNLRESTPDQRLALFINLYNMLVIHITHKYGPPTSVWQRRKFVNTTYYTIDGHNYALHSILNGILRGNRRGRDMLWKPFGEQDQRLPLAMGEMDGCIHFALSTADRGAGPLRAYSVYDIRRQLREQVNRLIGKDEWVKIEPKKKTILVSKIFKWFAEDFGTTNVKILEWIIEHMEDPEDEDKRKELKRMYLTGDYKMDYLNYDLSFNGVERCERPTLIPEFEFRMRTSSEPIEYAFSIPPTPTC